MIVALSSGWQQFIVALDLPFNDKGQSFQYPHGPLGDILSARPVSETSLLKLSEL